jgi:hypothetical protein
MDRIPARLADHPTVRKVLSRKSEKPGVIDADWLRQLCLDAGADDVAFASVENPALASEREHVDAALPGTLSYISLVVKMNRDNVRSTARSVANQEFHRSGEIMNEAAHRITRALQDAGYRAIKKDGEFDFVACSVHNYREFMGGFTDWAQTIADSADADDFRARVSDSENASMWQSLSFKANYKAAYCLAVCPAGEDVIEPYLEDRKGFMDLVLKPLQDKKETLYVLPNSAAKAHAERRYPHKQVKVVDSGIRGR